MNWVQTTAEACASLSNGGLLIARLVPGIARRCKLGSAAATERMDDMSTDTPIQGSINPFALMRPVPEFSLTSSDIKHGEPLPAEQYGVDAGGQDRSPQLTWAGFPEGTKSFAVTCYDPDAPTGSGFWHWAVANIPADVTSLPAGAGVADSTVLPEGSITLPNETRAKEFIGAGPPEGTGVHHYWFVVHALSVPHIDINPEATPAVLGFMMRDVTLARGIIVATGEYGAAA